MVFGFIRELLTPNPTGDVQPESRKDDPIPLAFCALLLEVATEDGVYETAERERIAQILEERYQLSHKRIEQLLQQTRDARAQSVDLFEFTNELNQRLGNDEKQTVMRDIWSVVFADGNLHRTEDHLAHKLGTLLRLPHRDIIDAKLKIKKELGLC